MGFIIWFPIIASDIDIIRFMQSYKDLPGNYPLEYREIGSNEKLKDVIKSNGGRVYNEDEVGMKKYVFYLLHPNYYLSRGQ